MQLVLIFGDETSYTLPENAKGKHPSTLKIDRGKKVRGIKVVGLRDGETRPVVHVSTRRTGVEQQVPYWIESSPVSSELSLVFVEPIDPDEVTFDFDGPTVYTNQTVHKIGSPFTRFISRLHLKVEE